MKKLLLISILAVLVMTACNEDSYNFTPTQRGTVTDNQGNTYEWVRIGALDWTTSNALNGTLVWKASYYHPDYETYRNIEFEADTLAYYATYGNLLSFEEALASAPEGWRLPTDEDWKNLERALGMTNEVDEVGWRGSISSRLTNTDIGIGLLPGGCVLYSSLEVSMACMLKYNGEAAYYWTSTIDESETEYTMAFYRKLVPTQQGIERQHSNIANKWMSVRWVRDAK